MSPAAGLKSHIYSCIVNCSLRKWYHAIAKLKSEVVAIIYEWWNGYHNKKDWWTEFKHGWGCLHFTFG